MPYTIYRMVNIWQIWWQSVPKWGTTGILTQGGLKRSREFKRFGTNLVKEWRKPLGKRWSLSLPRQRVCTVPYQHLMRVFIVCSYLACSVYLFACVYFFTIKYIFLSQDHSLTTPSTVEVGKPPESGCQSPFTRCGWLPWTSTYPPVCVLTLGPVLARCKTVFVEGADTAKLRELLGSVLNTSSHVVHSYVLASEHVYTSLLKLFYGQEIVSKVGIHELL